jgi:methionyl-tRNA formyltransferase
VCLMHMDEGLDTGPELARATLAIEPNETAGELADRLSKLGAQLLTRELPRFAAGELRAVPQPEGATLAPILKKEDGALDFTQPAQAIHDRVRGLSPWPGAYAFLETGTGPRERVKIHRTRVQKELGGSDTASQPGQMRGSDAGAILVATGQGLLAVSELQFEGGKRLPAATALAGRRLPPEARFAKPDA